MKSIHKFFLILFTTAFVLGSAEELKKDLPELSYPVTGTLYPIMTTKVCSQVPGRVLEMLVDVGDQVEKGQVLVRLDPAFAEIEFQKAKSAVKLARLGHKDAELQFQRMNNLWEKREAGKSAISRKQYDDADMYLQQKKVLLDQALLDLGLCKKKLDETAIKAPYKAVITHRYVDPGETITSNPVVNLVEIMDVSQLILEFSLPQDMSGKIQSGMPVLAKVDGQGKSVEGKIKQVFPQVDASNRCFKCRVLIDNSQMELKPGASVHAKIRIQ